MSKHTPEHAPGCPMNTNWDAASLCDKEPECTCGMSKHISGAEGAAQKIAFAIWPEEIGFTKDDSWISQKVAEFTTIITEETAAPDLLKLFAERDRLREACEAALRFQEAIDIDRLPEAIRGQGASLTIKLRNALAEPGSEEKKNGS